MPSPTTHTLSSPGKIQSWDEDRTITTTPRVTPASVKFALPELSSSLHSSYLMTYLPGGDASFIFTDVITSSAPVEQSKGFLGQEGSFVTQGKGTFEAKSYTVHGQFEIVEGTGTGGLQGIQGSGVFRSKPTETDKGSVEYSFEVKLPHYDISLGSKEGNISMEIKAGVSRYALPMLLRCASFFTYEIPVLDYQAERVEAHGSIAQVPLTGADFGW